MERLFKFYDCEELMETKEFQVLRCTDSAFKKYCEVYNIKKTKKPKKVKKEAGKAHVDPASSEDSDA